ncbi:MAG: aldose 1-epimerase [Pseudomonadota bacterium]|nr:aldose 1-epimerase [Pseudomonadota bacterium]
MSERLTIETDDILVEVLPSLGGSLAAFDLSRGNERLPVFRRWSGESENPRTFASIPMVPWFARISGGGITWDSRFYPIARNDPEDTHPLHGDGWRSPWEVVEHSAERVALRLRSRAIPPFDYEADLIYSVSGPALDVALSIRNCARNPVPYGMGLHPWFPRTPDVTLQASATGTWLPQPPELPTTAETDPIPAAWDFSKARRLPPEFIDNSFSGWDSRARIEWPDGGYAVTIEADPAIRLSHFYAPMHPGRSSRSSASSRSPT